MWDNLVNRTFQNSRMLLLWSAVHLLLILSLLVPPLNLITTSLIMVPLLYLYRRGTVKQFVIVYVLNLVVLYVIAGGAGLLLALVSLFFLPAVLVMGTLYKKQPHARTAILGGTLTLLGEVLLLLLIVTMAGVNPIESFQNQMNAGMELWKGVIDPQVIEAGVKAVVKLIPLYMVLFAVYYSLVTHGVARWALRKTDAALPKLPPLRTWRMPRSLVWYYLIVLVLDFSIKEDSESMLATVVINMMPLLTLAFVIQAISFLFYWAHVKRKGKFLPYTAIVLAVIWPPALYLISLLGLFDSMFGLRERLTDKP